ncbi:6825_t:CDS:10, partial [Funneliformis caledonium]
MSKCHNIPIKLILTGELVSHLHYGVNTRKWWEKQTIENTLEVNFLVPIRVKMKTQVELNNRVFTIQVTEEFGSPGYVCQSEQLSSNIENSPSQAICKLYQKIFKNSTRYSGNLVFGLKNKDITDQLLMNIPFRPFTIQIDKFSIIIYGLGVSTNENYLGAGPGYMFSFIHKYSQKRCVFVQKIRENDCIIQIWHENVKLFEYVGNTSVEQFRVPTCKPNQWNNKSVMISLYDYHLKRRTIKAADLLQFFINWSTGCTDITPFGNDISPYKFWTKSVDPAVDQACLKDLYQSGFLSPHPLNVKHSAKTFWNYFAEKRKPKRMKMDQIKESLIAKDIEFDSNSNKSMLVSLLEKQLMTEMMSEYDLIFALYIHYIKTLKHLHPKKLSVMKIYKWTLTSRNANRSDCYSASDMLNELNNMANKGELEFETIPRLETIQNWITRYSAACKREMADIVLQREEQSHYDYWKREQWGSLHTILNAFLPKSKEHYKAEDLKKSLAGCKKDMVNVELWKEYSVTLGNLAYEILTTGIRAVTGVVVTEFPKKKSLKRKTYEPEESDESDEKSDEFEESYEPKRSKRRKNKTDDKLPKDIKKWSPDYVKKFLEFRMKDLDFNETDVKKIRDQNLTGRAFLRLTEDKLTRKPGLYELKPSLAESIMELVEELNKKL